MVIKSAKTGLATKLARGAAGLVVLSLLGCPPAAQPPANPPPVANPPAVAPAVEENTGTLLFDGKTLENWKVTDFGLPGEAKAENGQLVIGPGTRLAGVNWTGKKLPRVNYEISAEAMKLEGQDFFIGLTFPVHESYCSLIVGGWGGNVVGLSNVNEEDASENETNSQREFESNKWYRVRVRVTDNNIDAWIDDDQVVKLDTTDKRIAVRLEMELQYPLGVATYRTKGAIRNLKLRELRPDELPPPPQSE